MQTRRKAPSSLDKWRVTRTGPAGEAVFTTVGLRGVAGLPRGCSSEAGEPQDCEPPELQPWRQTEWELTRLDDSPALLTLPL